MKNWKKYLAGLLTLTLMGVGFPKVAFCDVASLSAKDDSKTITWHEPKLKAEPEKDIPLAKNEKKGKMKWLLYGLGAATLAAVGLALGGGGGGGGGDSDNPSGNGAVSVSW